MLAALVRQAQHAGLTVEPGFAPKEIHWMAHVSLEGRFLGAFPLGESKSGKVFPRSPEFSKSELDTVSSMQKRRVGHFLAESCAVAVFFPELDKDGQIKDQEARERNLQKHTAFIEMTTQASLEVENLKPLASALAAPDQIEFLLHELTRQKAKSTEKITFAVETGIGGSVKYVPILENEDWHEWWRRYRQNLKANTKHKGKKANSGKKFLDFTSGQPAQPAKTHPKLNELSRVGALGMGAPLVATDKESFTSYGLVQGENSAVSEENAAAYRAALESLLERAPILGQMKVAVWFDHRQVEGQALIVAIEDPASLGEEVLEALNLDDVDENEVVLAAQTPEQQEAVAQQRGQKLLAAIRRGEQPESVTAQYFALAISGASGRAMVRDWKTGQLDHLASAVATWFKDLEIASLSGRRANRPKFKSLLMSIRRPIEKEEREENYLKPIRNLQLPLWRAALDPAMPIPFPAVAKVMEAHRSHVMTGAFTEALGRDGDGIEKGRIYIRMAILRAYHVRKARNQGGYSMQSSVDPKHPSPAYHCGRLMYLLANVQEAQGDDINAGVVQRYYGAASSTPALVLGRLTRLSQHHLAKISRDKPRLAFRLEEEIASVWAALGKQPPKTLSLEEQSLFALGYYQQLADSVANRKEAAAKNRADAAHRVVASIARKPPLRSHG